MNCIHENEVNKIAAFNLLHNIINPPKCTKTLNMHYYHILHGCMNTWKGGMKFNNLCILLDIVCSFTIVIRIIIKQINPKRYTVIQCHTQAGNITNNIKVK